MTAVLQPRGRHTWTLVFLHGYCMRARALRASLRRARPPGWRVVLPQAPRRPLPDGSRAPSWQDYLSDSGGAREDGVDPGAAAATRARLRALLRREARRVAGGLTRVVIGGLSQGGCVALDLCAFVQPAAVVTLVAHRPKLSAARPLKCSWHALTAEDDDVFPASWAHASLPEAATWERVPGGHFLERGQEASFLRRTLRNIAG